MEKLLLKIMPFVNGSESFCAVIEIPKSGRVKYELDKETGLLRMDRVLYTSTQYPANYGFIPLTYAEDNDPLDVLVLCSEPLLPLTLVQCFPIGVITMLDSNERDAKIIALPFGDPVYSGYTDISGLPPHISSEIMHFFSVYKALENKSTVVENIGDSAAAKNIIQVSIEAYHNKFTRADA